MTRLLCIGDLHLGAHPQYADDRLGDQQAVWQRALEVADEEGCDAVLFAGDAFEGPHVTPEQMDAFIRPLERAAISGLPTIAISGNGKHDSAMRRVNALGPLRHVPGLTVHSQPAIEMVGDVTVCCMPWASTKHLRAMGDELGIDEVDHVNEYAARAMVAVARGLREQGNGPAILLTHFSISGSSLPTGLPVDGLREPVIDHYALADVGFDAIAAGHIHQAQQIGFDEAPFFYTGSPMPLNFGEANVEHGVWILDVTGQGADALFVPIESRPFVTLDVELSDACQAGVAWPPDVWTDNAIVRVRYEATAAQARAVDENEIGRALRDAGAHRVYIERTTIREQRAHVEGLDDTVTTADALGLWLQANDVEAELADLIRSRHDTYTRELEGALA